MSTRHTPKSAAHRETSMPTSAPLEIMGSVKSAEKKLWEKIYNKSSKGRRTGVGITAEGDMLAAMGMRYGSEEAIKFSEEVHKTLALTAYSSSVQLAKERGAFEIFDYKREENNPFINRLREADPALYEEMKVCGRRNIACLTIAPTGTVSIMTQTTSGIEPVFMPVYKRRRKVNPNDPEVHVDFTDENGDTFEEYIVYHHKFVEWMKKNNIDTTKRYSQVEIDSIVARSPYAKATSNDIDWVAKVQMQGRIQKWVDHSISVTINLPNNVDEKLVNEMAEKFTDSHIGDCTNEAVIRSLGVKQMDCCFVSIGEDFQSSLVITSLLKRAGAKHVVAKANQEIQEELLVQIGADEVVYPEREIAEKLGFERVCFLPDAFRRPDGSCHGEITMRKTL